MDNDGTDSDGVDAPLDDRRDRATISSARTAVPLSPRVEFPGDPGLPGFARLFDGAWVWRAYCQRFGTPNAAPRALRVRQVAHSPGRRAVVRYDLEWQPDAYLPPDMVSVQLDRSGSAAVIRFPEDRRLPGLVDAARPDTALDLVNRRVLSVPARRVSVDVVRYRPGSRAVLRHRVGRVTFYVRVVRPAHVDELLAAAELVGRSTFVVPRLAGCWRQGGVLWLSQIPGTNLRTSIRQGTHPSPDLLLDGLERLWSAPRGAHGHRAFDLAAYYRRARTVMAYAAQGHDEANRRLDQAAARLEQFVENWRPTCLAHNDFYDDQLIAAPDGRLALVDFEDAGLGDPMLDVGNFLAHLRWSSRFGRGTAAASSGAFHSCLRRAALQRFRWPERCLDLRESVCLFRTCTNTIRRPRADWRQRLAAGLSLALDALGPAAASR